MTTIHVCDGYGGSEEMTLWCHYCGKDTDHDAGYLGVRCHVCRLDWSPVDGEILRYLQHVKRVEGLTWDELGERMGLKGSTVRTYAWKADPRLVDHLRRVGLMKFPERTEVIVS